MSALTFEGCLAQRLKVVHVDLGRISVEMGASGLICIGIGSVHELPPLIVVYDEGCNGEEVPLLSCLRDLLPLLASAWRGMFPVMSANVVTRDAAEKWDVAFVKWSQQALVRRLDAAPVRWAGEESRSEDAFVRAFGIQATRALHMLFKMRNSSAGRMAT